MAAPTGSGSRVPASLAGTSHRSSDSSRFQPRYVICVDYGTTFTGVGWILTKGRTPKLSDVRVVQNWGGNEIGAKVPSVLTYSANTGHRWGYGIGDSAYVIRWTKLKLEVPSRRDALALMRQTLEEAPLLNTRPQSTAQDEVPRHLIKTPAIIVTDYLNEVIYQVRLDIENSRETHTLENFPIDIVITHPAVWDARAQNLTFRAVLSAFRRVFHDIRVRPNVVRLASEPEACAQYTVQAAQADDTVTSQQLRAGECFIVVDAGGGTVDLVSYRIDQLTPSFKITKVTAVSSGRYGATRIDNCFLKEFLPSRLSEADYKRLMSLGGVKDRYGRGSHTVFKRGEQLVLKGFEDIKHAFRGSQTSRPDRETAGVLDLPPGIGLERNAARRTDAGQLFITSEDMEEMFSDCIVGIRKLIQEQLLQIDLDRRQLTVRTIFLSGGFSNSEYLFSKVNELARSQGFGLLRGSESWTAVARGGVLLGLGHRCQPPPSVIACPRSIGIVLSKKFALYNHEETQRYPDPFDRVQRARDVVEWVIHKGDMIKCDEITEKTVKLVRKVKPDGIQTGKLTIVTSSSDEPGQRYGPMDTSHREVVIDFNLADIPPDTRRLASTTANPRGAKSYERLLLQLDISISKESAEIALVCGHTAGSSGGGAVWNDSFLLGTAEPITFGEAAQ